MAEYDERWAGQFAEMAERLRVAFGASVTEIEHIGSTSVPGLLAKPVIDIAARAADLEVVAGKDSELATLGFVHEPTGPPNRRTYTRTVDGVLTHNLHVFPSAAWDELKQRILRDHLRAMPSAVQRYADLKRELAADGSFRLRLHGRQDRPHSGTHRRRPPQVRPPSSSSLGDVSDPLGS